MLHGNSDRALSLDRETVSEYFARLGAGGRELSRVSSNRHCARRSAEISGDGLLSWGMDPPAQGRVVAWHEQESWRLWVARRLALAMVGARSTGSAELSPAEFALERLRHDGVDVDGWTPSASLWRAA